MQKLLINGKKELLGEISISGSKNATLPILAATILSNKVKLKNIPLVQDIFTMIELLKSIGLNIGLLDADIYGPSIPRMIGVSKKPIMNENKKLIPIESYGIKCMSIGFILDEEAPTIWRGPMVMKALEQMFNGVDWGELDYLIIDLHQDLT